MKLEEALIRVVIEKVVHGDYPTPVPEIDETPLRQRIYDLKSERVTRPPKKEYVALIQSLEAELSDVISKNAAIRESNVSSRKSVDDKYKADLESAKLDEVNIGEALSLCVDYHLKDTSWYCLKDCGLTNVQQTVADAWRASMMSVTSEQTISLAITKFNTVVASKPDYRIKWK